MSADSWDASQPLLYVLRGPFGLHGPKFGCGLGQCGACTVLVDGQRGALVHAAGRAARAAAITTIEGLGTPREARSRAGRVHRRAGRAVRLLHERHDHGRHGAALTQTPKPTLDQVKQGLAGNLCRCGTHTRILRAVMRAARA